MYGVFLAFDYTKSPVSGITLLSRDSNPSYELLNNLKNSKIRYNLKPPNKF